MLAVLLLLQLGWTAPMVLPEDEPIVPMRLDPVPIAPVPVAPIVVQRSLFNVGRDSSSSGAATAAPLDGAVPVGVVSRGGRALVFLQAPGGAVAALGAGATYRGWMVTGVSASGIVVRRGGETARLPIGTSPGATTGSPRPGGSQ